MVKLSTNSVENYILKNVYFLECRNRILLMKEKEAKIRKMREKQHICKLDNLSIKAEKE